MTITKRSDTTASGRPRQFSDDAVLEKAMRIFWKRGFEGTSLQDLQAGMGLSRSSLYNAFGSKRALFERAMDRYGRERNVGILPSLLHGNRGLDDINAFFEGLAEALSTSRANRGCFMVNSMIEFGGDDAVVVHKGTAYFNRVQRAFAAALHRATERGEIDAGNIDDRARLLVTLAMGFNVQARAGSGARELARLAKIACDQTQSWRLQPLSRARNSRSGRRR